MLPEEDHLGRAYVLAQMGQVPQAIEELHACDWSAGPDLARVIYVLRGRRNPLALLLRGALGDDPFFQLYERELGQHLRPETAHERTVLVADLAGLQPSADPAHYSWSLLHKRALARLLGTVEDPSEARAWLARFDALDDRPPQLTSLAAALHLNLALHAAKAEDRDRAAHHTERALALSSTPEIVHDRLDVSPAWRRLALTTKPR